VTNDSEALSHLLTQKSELIERNFLDAKKRAKKAACAPLDGSGSVTASRTRPTLLEISFNVEADDEPAKLHGTLATIPIPADARVVDAICAIGSGGEKQAIDCSSKAEEPWAQKSNGTGERRAQ